MRSGCSRSWPPPRPGLILVNINPAYRRQRAAIRVEQGRCRALILSPRFKSSDYLEMLHELAPELRLRAGRARRGERIPTLSHGDPARRDGKTPGMLNFDELLAMPARASCAASRPCGATLQFDDPINIQFTSGTTGLAKGRHADASQHPEQRLLRRRGDAASASSIACAFPCRCITASAWCSAISCASRMARRWSIRTRASTPRPCSRPSRRSVARRCMACRRCSSPMLEHPRVRALRPRRVCAPA